MEYRILVLLLHKQNKIIMKTLFTNVFIKGTANNVELAQAWAIIFIPAAIVFAIFGHFPKF